MKLLKRSGEFGVWGWATFVWCCFLGPLGIGVEGYAPKVGEKHPDLLLPRIDNREAVSLTQFRGKKVLLIHFASW